MESELKPIQDEVLRRVGRNLLVFQQIEHFLKFVLTNHKNGGTAETYERKFQEQVECISTEMLGTLVKSYVNEILEDAGVDVPEEERPAGWFSFSFKVSADAEFIESMRRDFKLMTEERNDLVHHFLPRWQPGSAEKLNDALAYLDTQREKALPMHMHLRNTVNRMQESKRALMEFMNSPEYDKQSELMWLQASPLVCLLREVARHYHRQDGWTYLAQAGSLATKEIPEDVINLKERYGFSTLRKLLVGSEMFDVFDEALQSGFFRTLYRVKPEN